ncbi:MAG: hypothetical protein ACRDPC_04075 [Solirubrobacteraceae bacterium]
MGYVIAAVVVVLVVAGFVAFLVLNSTRKGGPNPRGGGPPGVGPDEQTPLGDTDQHAGEQTREGETVRAPEGEGRERGGGTAGGEGGVGGEGEGSRTVTPESERLANRPR